MKLNMFLEKNAISVRRMREELAEEYPNAPGLTTLQDIAVGTAEPRLELALMISKWSKGQIDFHDLLVDRKRKYTEHGDAIFSFTKPEVDRVGKKKAQKEAQALALPKRDDDGDLDLDEALDNLLK